MSHQRASRAAAILAVCVALAACGSGGISAPNTQDNAALIQQFQALSVQAAADSESQLSDIYQGIVQSLAMGAPVNQIDIDVDGHPEHFSALASMLYVHHAASGASDSTIGLQAWHGANSDTVVVMQYYSDAYFGPGFYHAFAHVLLTIGRTEWEAQPDTATVQLQETRTGGACAPVSSSAQGSLPAGWTCLNDRLAMSFDTTALHFSMGPAGGPHEMSLAHTVLSGIRLGVMDP